jgi:hypothetical protein
VRHKGLQVARTRVQTVLNRLTPKDEGRAVDIAQAAALEKVRL